MFMSYVDQISLFLFQISSQHTDRGVTCFESFQNMTHEDLAECIYIKVINYTIEIPQGECTLRM